MTEQRTRKFLLYVTITLLFTGFLLVMAIRADIDSHDDAIKLKDEKVKSLTKDLEDEKLEHLIDRGRLDVICENHPLVCQELE